MSDFEFYFSFFGLLLGLSVAEVIGGLSKALNSRREVALGVLTPLFALFLLMDMASFWVWAWASRDAIRITWAMVFGGLAAAATYYLGASMLFPTTGEWQRLEDHYWAKKRWIAGCVMLPNIALVAFTYGTSPPKPDFWLFFYQAAYWLPLLGLLWSRRKWIDLVLIGLLILQYLVTMLPFLPTSSSGVGAAS